MRCYPENNYLETEFPGGYKVPASANDDEHSIRLAEELGYDGNTFQMSIAHELSHVILSEALGHLVSPTLYGVAVGRYAARPTYQQEEGMVLAMQKYTMLGEYSDELKPLVDAGCDLAALRGQLLALAHELGGPEIVPDAP